MSNSRGTPRGTIRPQAIGGQAGTPGGQGGDGGGRYTGEGTAPSVGAVPAHTRNEYFDRMNRTLPIIGEKLMRTRYDKHPDHDMHVLDMELNEARLEAEEEHAAAARLKAIMRHPNYLPASTRMEQWGNYLEEQLDE